jgi:general secretion pathway protein G
MNRHTTRRGHPAFTLIELMAVVLIMILLAGLVIAGLQFVNERQSRDRAKVQLALLGTALQEYYADYREYPDSGESATGLNTSHEIYQALYYDGSQDTTGNTRIYLPELAPDNKHGWTSGDPSTTTKITDPWGNEYRYRSAAPNRTTQNPDYDLWSAGKDGESEPDSSDPVNEDDLRNF